MGRGKDFREPRRRGFADDEFPTFRERGDRHSASVFPSAPPPRFEAPSGPPTTAVVKWFNAEKGFGFVELADGTGDAFLHVRALERAGHTAVSPGATLQVRTGQGQKGLQVTEVLEVDESTATPEAPRRSGAFGSRAPADPQDRGSAVEITGLVKFYNAEKGFGFVSDPSGGKDVFVHTSALRRAGVAALQEGQRVTMQVVEGRKGPEAATIVVVG